MAGALKNGKATCLSSQFLRHLDSCISCPATRFATHHRSLIKGCRPTFNFFLSFFHLHNHPTLQSPKLLPLRPKKQIYYSFKLPRLTQTTQTTQTTMHSSILLSGLFAAVALAQSSAVPAISQISDGQIQATASAPYVHLHFLHPNCSN
jgi:hypothetical protein